MSSMSKPGRRNLRFTSDQSLHAEIQFDYQNSDFTSELAGIICNESYSGCCLAITHHDRVREGARFKVRVANLAPLLGEVKWVHKVDPEVWKIGIQFLE